MSEVVTRPLILVRGFGGLDIGAEQANAYQGFNEGTVYPGRRGDNYIYEGFLLRAMKSTDYPYTDATNVVGYYSSPVTSPGGDLDAQDLPVALCVDAGGHQRGHLDHAPALTDLEHERVDGHDWAAAQLTPYALREGRAVSAPGRRGLLPRSGMAD